MATSCGGAHADAPFVPVSLIPKLNPAGLPAWKRALDLLCCLAALPFLGAAIVMSAVLMSILSRGPVFYRQERVGHHGRRFTLLKLRTMRVAADTGSHASHFSSLVRANTPMEKLDVHRDTRLIPGGWLLRASGLDELPQVINVLRGEMSIVGPRPCIPYEYEYYSPAQRLRFRCVPGLTGLWQVSGKNRTTFEEMIRLDVAYSERFSLRRDLSIIARTPLALTGQVFDTVRRRRSRPPRCAVEPASESSS